MSKIYWTTCVVTKQIMNIKKSDNVSNIKSKFPFTWSFKILMVIISSDLWRSRKNDRGSFVFHPFDNTTNDITVPIMFDINTLTDKYGKSIFFEGGVIFACDRQFFFFFFCHDDKLMLMLTMTSVRGKRFLHVHTSLPHDLCLTNITRYTYINS